MLSTQDSNQLSQYKVLIN